MQTLPLHHLSDSRLGIDAAYYIQNVLEDPETREPLLAATGGLPLTLSTPRGVDCTANPGIADVSCQMGKCVVHRCMPGYTRNADGTSCERAKCACGVLVANGETTARRSCMRV